MCSVDLKLLKFFIIVLDLMHTIICFIKGLQVHDILTETIIELKSPFNT